MEKESTRYYMIYVDTECYIFCFFLLGFSKFSANFQADIKRLCAVNSWRVFGCGSCQSGWLIGYSNLHWIISSTILRTSSCATGRLSPFILHFIVDLGNRPEFTWLVVVSNTGNELNVSEQKCSCLNFWQANILFKWKKQYHASLSDYTVEKFRPVFIRTIYNC